MKTYILLAISCLLILCTCTDLAVYSDYDIQKDFTSYKTYLICSEDIEVKDKNQPMYDNTFNRKHIKKAIQTELNNMGYQEVESNADIQVNFQIIIKDRNKTIKTCSGAGVYDYWPNCSISNYDYTEGTLVINISDIKENQIIWQGTAIGILNINPKKIKKVIAKTVKEIFQNYPVKEI
jgi:hypothetical protein